MRSHLGKQLATRKTVREQRLHGRARPIVRCGTGTISLGFVRPVVECLRAGEVDVDGVLRLAGIPSELLTSNSLRVTARQYSALWKLVIEHLDDEFFGQDSRRMKAGSFALMARSATHCANLGEALKVVQRFFGIFLDDLGVGLSAELGESRISIAQLAQGPCKAFAHETLLVMVLGLGCWLVGRRILISSASFAFTKPAHFSEYEAIFGSRLAFEQPVTRIQFSSSYLKLPVIQSAATLKQFLREAPENILVKYKNKTGLTATIRKHIKANLPHALPTAALISRRLHMTQSTLARRLRSEGHTYQSIKNDVRRELAVKYLTDTSKGVRAIATALGFLDRTSFHRAFLKWTGDSPSAYRLSSRGNQTLPEAGRTSGRALD